MKIINEIRENIADEAGLPPAGQAASYGRPALRGLGAADELPRWILIALGAAVAFLLAMTIETGRAHAAGSNFSFQGYLSKFITPNGDALNPRAILCVDNPKDLSVRGRVFDLRGNHVADMTHLTKPQLATALATVNECENRFGIPFKMQAVVWDGQSIGGGVVTSGVYIWRIEAEESAVTGTVVVAR